MMSKHRCLLCDDIIELEADIDEEAVKHLLQYHFKAVISMAWGALQPYEEFVKKEEVEDSLYQYKTE